MARVLCDKYDGEVPSTLEELIALPGIGRKTANLVMGDIFGMPGAVVVDTHCIRITRRLGLHSETDQRKIEMILRGLLPPEESNDFCHRLVLHGRAVCTARKAMCESCCMSDFAGRKRDRLTVLCSLSKVHKTFIYYSHGFTHFVTALCYDKTIKDS